MLPKENRLKNKKDFEKVFKNGKGLKEGLLYVKFAGNNLAYSRFGFIVSTKVSKKAVVRNKIKRVLREAVKSEIKNIKKGIDAAIIVNPGIKKEELSLKIKSLFKKAKLI